MTTLPIRPGDKLKSLEALRDIIRDLKAREQKVVHCHGVFDLIHPGHLRHLEAAKEEGDALIVTITKDEYVNKGPGRPVFSHRLRAESVAALQVVDYVAINESPTAVEAIRLLRPDVYVKGADYENRDQDITGRIHDEERAVIEVGGRIHFTHDIMFSSTQLLNSYFAAWPDEADAFLRDFRKRYTADAVIERLKATRKMRVLIVGDAIIDEYCFCDVLGKSSKAHAINARFLNAESYTGGALAVANHMAGFCDTVHLVTCLGGRDSWRHFVTEHLRPNISTRFFERPDAPTTVKRRFTDTFRYTQLFEISFLTNLPLPSPLRTELQEYLSGIMADYDLVVAADFGHGLIDQGTAQLMSKKAPFLAANVQVNSANTGYNMITKYPHVDYICLQENELRLAYHDELGALEPLIERATADLKASTAAITLGPRGSFTYQPASGFARTPVFSNKVVDTLGAGDAYLSVTAPCAAAGYPADLIGFIGDAVGALKVLILGNKTSVEPVQLFKFITTLLK